jgi:protein-disulfide isomerase
MPPQNAAPQVATGRDMSALYTPVAIIVAGALVGVGLFFGLSHQTGSAPQGGTPTVSVNIKDVKTDGDPYIGNKTAPVTIAFWADFQCPYCKAIEVGGVPQINDGPQGLKPAIPDIIKTYVDTGKVRIVFKDFPFLGNDSITGGEYARAVWKLYPDQYYAFRTAMFTAQDAEGDEGFGDEASIVKLIQSKLPRVDSAKVKADVASNKAAYDAAMDADRNEGASFGVQGTPGFITGTTLIPGAAPFSTFTAAIDPQLK